jgi:hypothetical protein
VALIVKLAPQVYAGAKRLHLVLDNLHPHLRFCCEDVLGPEAAATVLERVEFHYTPKHASWLNQAELEIGIMEKQGPGRRLATAALERFHQSYSVSGV